MTSGDFNDARQVPALPSCGGTGRFRPIAFVGRGSMGAVYRVYDEELASVVALKTLDNPGPEQIYRLKSEFRVIAGVTHPNLVQLHELVVTDAECFFTMEFVDGPDFVGYVRAADSDAAIIERFVAVAPQLVHGVAALHAAGRLHRDIKPSNIRVTPAGHVVLLDFDLAAPLTSESGVPSFASAAAGTFAYMAPEQAWGAALGPAADLYAMGVVFFEALTGRLPFEGPPAELLLAKETNPAVSLRHVVPTIPAWLDELTTRLLRVAPDERPTINDVLERLGGAEPATPAALAEMPFVGRQAEQRVLHELYAQMRAGQSALVSISGASGIGKTELIRRFLATVDQDAGAWVLRGRCHPEEAVPYKAFDALIDALSRRLLQIDPATIPTLAPGQVSALLRLFPVLGRVPAWAAWRDADLAAEPYEVRRRGFSALRELLVGIADRGPLVLWIDDLQWSDLDSAALLREILRPPAPRILLLVSFRDEERAAVAKLLPLAAGMQPGVVALHELQVEPLSLDDSRTLAQLLGADATDDSVSEIAAEAAGSPFFVTQLARHASSRSLARTAPSALRLATAVNERVQSLSPTARDILEVVSVAGRPLDRKLVLAAANASPRERPLLLTLEHGHLVRSTTLGGATGVEIYHDRIRETIIADLSAASLRDCHRRLAAVLSTQEDPDPDALFRHFLGGEEKERAAEWAVIAGDRDHNALAFGEAADRYGHALVLKRWSHAEAAALSVKRADALVNAGRGAEAAPLLLDVSTKVAADDALEHRRRAAEQFMVSGRTDDGIAVLRPLLRELGLRYPATPAAAMRATLLRLVQFALRGSRFNDRTEAEIPSAQLRRIDLCYSAARGLVSVDTVRGGYLALVGLLLALEAGEPVRIGRSMVFTVGAVLAPAGGFLTAWGMRLLDVANRISQETQNPYLLGGMGVTLGQAKLFRGEWSEALAHNDAGLTRLRASCRGVGWECNFARSGALRALEELGRWHEFTQRAQEMATVANELGDRYAEITAALYVGIGKLVAGDVPGARDQLRAALARWSQQGFHLQHFYALRIEALGDVYEGDHARAWQRVADAWSAIERSFFLRVSVTRIDAYFLRARVALAAAVDARDRTQRLSVCARDIRRLRRERRADTDAHAALLQAGMAAIQGHTNVAVRQLDDAVRGYERVGMTGYAACALRRKGELLEGSTLTARADDLLRAAGVRDPSRWVAINAPGFSSIIRHSGESRNPGG